MNVSGLITIEDSDILQNYKAGIKLTKPHKNFNGDNFFTAKKLLDQPNIVAFLDTDSRIIRGNDTTLAFNNFSSDKNIARGQSVRDTMCEQYADILIMNDYHTMKAERLMIVDESAKRLDGHSFDAISFKFPLYDQSNQIIGLGCQAFIIKDNKFSNMLNLLQHTAGLGITSDPNIIKRSLSSSELDEIYLTRRETDVCIF